MANDPGPDTRETHDADVTVETPCASPLIIAAHELRTPLCGIAAVFETLQREALSPRQQRLVELGQMASGHLQSLLDETLSKVTARASLSPQGERFDLRRLCGDTVAFWEPVAQHKNLPLDLIIDPAVPTVVWGDSLRLRQVLFNLLANAIKFTQEGCVALRVGTVHDAPRHTLRFVVEDTGIGISAEDQEKLFQPFQQAGAAATGAYGGSGLGLSICLTLVETMGGTITLHSSPGVGTRVTVQLTLPPAEPGAQAAAPMPRKPALAQAADAPDTNREIESRLGRVVLLVEDNPLVRELIGLQLEQLGYVFDAVPDGASALTALQRRCYGLVLTDIRMAGLDGMRLARHIRRTNILDLRGRPLPIVAISADLPSEPVSGIDGWLAKPIAQEKLEACLQRWLPRRCGD